MIHRGVSNPCSYDKAINELHAERYIAEFSQKCTLFQSHRQTDTRPVNKMQNVEPITAAVWMSRC